MLSNIMLLFIIQFVGILFLLYYLHRQSGTLHYLEKQAAQQNQYLDDRLHTLEKNNLSQSAILQSTITEKMHKSQIEQTQQFAAVQEQLQRAFAEYRARFDERQLEALKILHDTLQKGAEETHKHVKEALTDYAQVVGRRVEQLTETTDQRLKEINQHVEKRLTEGFEKTNETFGNIIKRLALIDAAQQKITELSTNVVSLQEILTDKRSRGTFGEVQLASLIRNVLPEHHFAFQHTLSNDKRVDCILYLPEPTGNITIDAKFPLENFRILLDSTTADSERRQAEQQFRQDIRKHIQDIAEKYILPGETADGAIMFIPAEAVFAEIHARFPELVETAHRAKVWMVSPTTMMAILTTARAVLKDADTRKQLHIIQKHLRSLATDFERFQKRMDNLSKHIAKAHTDVDQVHLSAKKISQRFGLIEKVELEDSEERTALTEE